MGWNEPNKGKEPWDKKQPPDLDDMLKRLSQTFKRFFQKGGQSSLPLPNTNQNGLGLIAGIIAGVVLILWFLAGIFIVDPAEQAAILRFGQYVKTVGPGPHWIPRFIESKMVVNVEKVSDYSYSAQMLTSNENLVSVSVVVQYRIGNLNDYLFNVTDPEESLRQATSSALRQTIGNATLDQVITDGREVWGTRVQDSLVNILETYKTGIIIVNVSPQPARAPENVQEAFDDTIKAQEDQKRFIGQALAYKAKVVPIARGNAKRILSAAEAFAEQTVLKAKGDVAEFLAVLPQFVSSPEVTSQRMYFDTLQGVLSKSSKIIVENKGNNLIYLPLDKLNNNIETPAAQARAQSISGNQATQLMDLEHLQANRDVVRPTDRNERDN